MSPTCHPAGRGHTREHKPLRRQQQTIERLRDLKVRVRVSVKVRVSDSARVKVRVRARHDHGMGIDDHSHMCRRGWWSAWW